MLQKITAFMLNLEIIIFVSLTHTLKPHHLNWQKNLWKCRWAKHISDVELLHKIVENSASKSIAMWKTVLSRSISLYGKQSPSNAWWILGWLIFEIEVVLFKSTY